MGVVADEDGGALVSDTRAPSRRAETIIDGAESELHTNEMEMTPITEDKQVSKFVFVYVLLLKRTIPNCCENALGILLKQVKKYSIILTIQFEL